MFTCEIQFHSLFYSCNQLFLCVCVCVCVCVGGRGGVARDVVLEGMGILSFMELNKCGLYV